MKLAFFRCFRAILAVGALSAWTASGAETGTVTAGTVNVRGRAGFIGEVITRVSKGETVTILDTVTLTDPKPGEPAEWLKIALPANTPVWIHASYIDPATQTVTASRLKVRGGPGINYSVLGFLSQGSAVNELRREGEWAEIQPTSELFAFVAASMVARESAPTETAAPAVAAANTQPPGTTQPVPEPPVTEPPVATPPAVTEPAPETVATTTDAPALPVGADIGVPPTTQPAIAPPPGGTAIVAEPAPAIETAPVDANRDVSINERAQRALEERIRNSQRWEEPGEPDDRVLRELPEHRRLVVREGKIRRAMSIQAPGDYILQHAESGLRLNYLYTSSTNIPLKDLSGIKVRIRGEEGIDPRWPGTPVLLIKSLEVLP